MIFFMDNLEKFLLIIIFLICVFALGASGFFSELIKNNQNPAEYHVSDSSFKIDNWWSVINSTNNSVEFIADHRDDGFYPIYLRLTQYNNTSIFESKYLNSSSSSDYYNIKIGNRNIEGIEVRFINSTDSNHTKTFLDYYFQKNGKYYSIHIMGDSYPVNEIHNNRIEATLKLIISTIN